MGHTDAVQPTPEEPGSFRPVMHWLLLGTVGGLALVALALVLIPGSRPSGGKPSTAATPAPPAASPDPAFPAGATMEVTGHALASTKALSDAIQGPNGPAGDNDGTDVLGTAAGNTGRIVSTDGDAVQLQMLDGDWAGRTAWARKGDLKPLPTPAAEEPAPDVQEPAPDVVDGLPLPKRQEIFLALSRMFAAAGQEALARYPIKKTFNGNMLEVTKQRYDQRKFSEDFMAKGRRELAERYKIDDAALERINQEGAEKKWPRE